MSTSPAPIVHSTDVLVKSPGSLVITATLNSMIHHKVISARIVGKTIKDIENKSKPYGVSSSYKVLDKGLLLKKFDLVRGFLRNTLRLPPKQRDVALAFLRLQAYYPQVYPKASQLAEMANVSIPTVWRAVKVFEDMNLIQVVNRFLVRADAQISNLYLLHVLILLIARYLAEQGVAFREKWLAPVLSLPGSSFWPDFWRLANGERPP